MRAAHRGAPARPDPPDLERRLVMSRPHRSDRFDAEALILETIGCGRDCATTSRRPSTLSDLDVARAVDRACEAFETAWRDGDDPRIEDRLDVPSNVKERLLFELLALEIELRRGRGEQPSASEYVERFPNRVVVVARAFAESASAGEVPGEGESKDAEGRPAPQRFGDYELLDELARGGMGVVYRARQVSLNRTVALKMILSGRFATEAELRRFRVEAEAAAQLDHPNIVPILDVGRHQGHAYFSMKLVPGGNLTRHLARYQGDHAAAARLTATIARGIDYAHGRGLIHRDLKPSNILLDDSGRPLIADFGLVKRTEEGLSLTLSGAIVGTPGYMAPEQISGGAVTVAADVYSLGAILYQLLTGRPPFRGAGAAETMARVLEYEPTPPRSILPSIPRELELIALKCLEKEPARRYESAGALADDLERFLQGEDVHVGAPGAVRAIRRWTRREPEFACRIVAQGLILGLTQLNHLANRSPDVPVHLATVGAEAVWLASTLLLRRLARVERRWELVRTACIGVDLLLTTAILRILRAADSSLVVAYVMLIAASGLWNRVRLVWQTTALAMLGYSILAADAYARGVPRDSNHHPNIILTAMAVTGLIIAQQVRRIRALTSESAGTT